MTVTHLPTGEFHRILSSIVGSRAHGMETDSSDLDVRSVEVLPTSKLLALSASASFLRERGGSRDESFWELRRFFDLALKGDPNTLETLVSPVEFSTEEGDELRALFPKFLQRERIYHGFLGFARAQRYSVAERPLLRPMKTAVHYARIIFNGLELLRSGKMTVRVVDTQVGQTLMKVKLGELPTKAALALGAELEGQYAEALRTSPLPVEADLEALNDFYLRVRKAHW